MVAGILTFKLGTIPSPVMVVYHAVVNRTINHNRLRQEAMEYVRRVVQNLADAEKSLTHCLAPSLTGSYSDYVQSARYELKRERSYAAISVSESIGTMDANPRFPT